MIKGNLNYLIEYNNKIVIKNFNAYAGDSVNIIIIFKDIITDAFFTVYDSNNNVVLEKKYNNGINNLNDFHYSVELSANDTIDLENDVYYYELVFVIDNIYITVMSGSIDVLFSSIGGYKTSFVDQMSMIDLSEFANRSIVNLDFSVQKIRGRAFLYQENLALTSLPDGVTYIGAEAFLGCTSLALTSLPESLTTIGASAFYNCTNLALTSLPENLTTIGASAFYNCTNLALTSLPEGLTTIDKYTFLQCTNLALTSLPESLTTIGDSAFYRCFGISTLRFKGVPSSISKYAFLSCDNLTDIYVPWSVGAVANAPWGAIGATIHYNS